MSHFYDKQAYIIETFNTSSRYLDHIFNIICIFFDNMVSQVNFAELQLTLH